MRLLLIWMSDICCRWLFTTHSIVILSVQSYLSGNRWHRVCASLADTSFMYMIAGLCMLKLYQKRHPDINASAYSAYACLAVVIFFSVLGVVGAVLAQFRTVARTHAAHVPFVCVVCGRCSGRGTWCSGSFSLSSTFWPPSSSARSSTTWVDGGWVRPRHASIVCGKWQRSAAGSDENIKRMKFDWICVNSLLLVYFRNYCCYACITEFWTASWLTHRKKIEKIFKPKVIY